VCVRVQVCSAAVVFQPSQAVRRQVVATWTRAGDPAFVACTITPRTVPDPQTAPRRVSGKEMRGVCVYSSTVAGKGTRQAKYTIVRIRRQCRQERAWRKYVARGGVGSGMRNGMHVKVAVLQKRQSCWHGAGARQARQAGGGNVGGGRMRGWWQPAGGGQQPMRVRRQAIRQEPERR